MDRTFTPQHIAFLDDVRAWSQDAMPAHIEAKAAIGGNFEMSEELDIGLYFKRMHILNTLFGDEETPLARYASLPSLTAQS